jgi:hypothetical protein
MIINNLSKLKDAKDKLLESLSLLNGLPDGEIKVELEAKLQLAYGYMHEFLLANSLEEVTKKRGAAIGKAIDLIVRYDNSEIEGIEALKEMMPLLENVFLSFSEMESLESRALIDVTNSILKITKEIEWK